MSNQYDYTCQVGQAVDSNTQLACSDGYYGKTYIYRNGTWWTLNTYCMTKDQCQPKLGPALDQYSYLPCIPRNTPAGILLECIPNSQVQTWNVKAQTSTSCPINQVLRSPYPRSLVNVPTDFSLQWQQFNAVDGISSTMQSPANLSSFVDASGNPTADGYNAGIWKNLVLVMRSERLKGGVPWLGQTVPEPSWVFSDRDWNNGGTPVTASGEAVSYTYQTSSAGLTTLNGRRFDSVAKSLTDIYDLPAYGVAVTSYCGHEWKVDVTIAVMNWHPSGPCYQSVLNPDGTTQEPPGTSNQGCDPGWVAPGTASYAWQDKPTGWAGIDLTLSGRATTYDQRTRTQSGGGFNGLVYWDTPAGNTAPGVWVPVVEVQSVLRDACVANGLCTPPGAEPSSVAP